MSPLTQQWSKSSSICSLCTGASWKIQVSSLPRASWSRFSWQLFSPAHPFCIATDRPAAYTKLLSPFDEEVDKTPVIRSVMLKLLLKYRWAESVIGCYTAGRRWWFTFFHGIIKPAFLLLASLLLVEFVLWQVKFILRLCISLAGGLTCTCLVWCVWSVCANTYLFVLNIKLCWVWMAQAALEIADGFSDQQSSTPDPQAIKDNNLLYAYTELSFHRSSSTFPLQSVHTKSCFSGVIVS